jgi:hypothetical protein
MILFAQTPDPGAAIELDRAALGRLARAMPSA